MSFESRICANPECQRAFTPKVHNAIYHDDECRRVVTNQKVLDKYYEKKERKEHNRTTKRVCVEDGCDTILSRYNDEDICEPCKTERLINRLASWGWDEENLRDEWSY